MSFEHFQEAAIDYEKLFETDEGYDVIIYAGENNNVKEIHAHSLILRTRSQYFRTGFSKEWAEKKGGIYIFKKPNISPQSFKIILRYIYCGKIDLTNLQGSDILKLLIAVDELGIQILITCIQEYLIKHQREFLQQNSVETLETIYQHELFTDLWNFYLEEICEEPEILFNSDKFINLNAPLLESFLKRDDLNLNEILIWDNLIKWCLAQNSNTSQDIKKWNKDDITIMERTIHKFSPLIRFYDISPEDFLSKVYPYKVLLPEDLISNILTFHMVPNKKLDIDIPPPRKPKFICDSILVESQHFAIFSSWIEKKNYNHYNVRNIPYSFNLLYRASRDGNTVENFHTKCDNKGATIVVVKITNSEQIVGGYNPLFWDSSNSNRNTFDSFVFSFTDRQNLQTARVGYSKGDGQSIRSRPIYGPYFGNKTLRKHNGGWYGSNAQNYTIDLLNGTVYEDDYEVFQVIKK